MVVADPMLQGVQRMRACVLHFSHTLCLCQSVSGTFHLNLLELLLGADRNCSHTSPHPLGTQSSGQERRGSWVISVYVVLTVQYTVCVFTASV